MQLGRTFLAVSIPIYAAKYYMKFFSKEKFLFLTMLNKRKVNSLKHILPGLFSLSLFGILLLLGVVPSLGEIPKAVIIIICAFFILFVVSILPLTTNMNMFYSKTIKSNRFWSGKISNKRLLPIRAILLREFLYIWRENKFALLKFGILSLLANTIFILFIVNNNKEDFFIWAFFLQFIIVLYFIIQYPSVNNFELMKFSPGNSSSILIAEFIFWSAIIFIQLIMIMLLYYFSLSQIDFVLVAESLILFMLLLAYVLLIRLAYMDNPILRSLIFLLIFIPITIPFFIYNSYRRLKC